VEIKRLSKRFSTPRAGVTRNVRVASTVMDGYVGVVVLACKLVHLCDKVNGVVEVPACRAEGIINDIRAKGDVSVGRPIPQCFVCVGFIKERRDAIQVAFS